MPDNPCFELENDEISTPEFGEKIRECKDDIALLEMIAYHTIRVDSTAREEQEKWLETLWFLFGHFAFTRRYLLYFFVKSVIWKNKGWKPGLRDHIPPVYQEYWEQKEQGIVKKPA